MKFHRLIATCFLSMLPMFAFQDTEDKDVVSNQDAREAFFLRIKRERVESDPIVDWHNIGPGMSGYNEELWTHPSDPNVLLIGPDMHVSYGSWDGGKSWISLQDHDAMGQQMKRIIDIEFSRQDPDYAVALDWNGWIYESLDRGRSWKKLTELSPSFKDVGHAPYHPEAFKRGWYDEQLGLRLSELAIDPTNDDVWYVGAGDFWNVKENHRSQANPKGNRLTYADYGYLLKTTDRGRTWVRISAGLPEDLDVGKIIVHPLEPDHVWMATNHGLFASHDRGRSWEKKALGLPNNVPRDLTSFFDKDTREFVLFLVEQTFYENLRDTVVSKGGIYKSVDGGKSWQDISGNLAIDLANIHYPAELDRYFRTLANWFGISKIEARRKYTKLPKSVLPVFNRIVVNPRNQNEIYITYNKKHDRTFGPGEVWRTLDGGRTWIVVARHGNYWIRGIDNGYWANRGNSTGANVQFSHVQEYMDARNESEGNRLLAVNSNGELFISVGQQTQKSSDKGESWQQIDDFETYPGSKKWIGRGNSNLPGRFMLHETGIPARRLFASGEHGVWQTTNLGDWADNRAVALEQIEGQNSPNGAHSISTLAVHPQDPNKIYILAWRQEHRGKLRRTTDGGKSWTNIATVLANANTSEKDSKQLGKVIQGPPGMLPAQNSLRIDPADPDNMYFVATEKAFSEIYRAPRRTPSVGGYGFLRSTDGGFTWELSNHGFHEGFSLRRIILDPDKPAMIYAAANDDNGGLYRSTDRGQNWQRVDIPQEIKAVNNVFIDRNTKQILISAGRPYSGSSEEGGAWRSKDGGKSWQKIFKAPLVTQVESSPVDSDILVLTVMNQLRADRQFMNPGIYLSLDGGNSWKKINRNLSNNDKIVDAKPDPYNKNVIWAAGWGSGWYVGYINGTTKEGWLTTN
jgi:photosystem II stability/assembly factor-like uncharacterized protein